MGVTEEPRTISALSEVTTSSSTAEGQDGEDGADPYSDYNYVYFGDAGSLRQLFEALVYVTGILGVCTNLFVLVVLCSSSHFRSKASYLLLINQTVADLFTSVMVLLTYVLWFMGLSHNRVSVWGSFGHVYCALVNSEVLLYTGLYASAFNIVYLAADRLLMIVRPLVHRLSLTKMKILPGILLTWLLAFACNVPTLVSSYLTDKGCYMDVFLKSKKAQMAYGCTLATLTFFIPITFLLYSYGHMIYVLRQSSTTFSHEPSMQSNTNLEGSSTNKKQLSTAQLNLFKIVIAIGVIFILTWCPLQVYYVIYSTGVPVVFDDAFYYIGMSLAITNSSINPFVYILKYKQFQEQARSMLCLKGEQKDLGSSGVTTVSNTSV